MTQILQSSDVQVALAPAAGQASTANPGMFFKRWLANPLQMGSIVPSSNALCQRIVRQTRRTGDEVVIELGAGTGVISQALLDSGLPAERLFVVEIVPDMAAHLRRVLPGVNVIEGDARSLPALIPGALAWPCRHRRVRHPAGASAQTRTAEIHRRDRGGRTGPRLPAL